MLTPDELLDHSAAEAGNIGEEMYQNDTRVNSEDDHDNQRCPETYPSGTFEDQSHRNRDLEERNSPNQEGCPGIATTVLNADDDRWKNYITLVSQERAMRKYTLLLALIALLAACRHYGTYEDRDKWMLPYRMTRMTLRNRPRQVTEYIYSASDTARPEVRRKYYNSYKFDPEGNMVSRNVYQDDTLWIKFEYWVDRDGMQQSSTPMGTGKVSLIVSRRLSDGRYMIINPDLTGRSNATILSFPSGGDEKIREEYSDSTAHGDPFQVVHFYYKGNRLLRVMYRTAEGSQEVVYFYSHSDAPDSLHIYQGSSASGNLLQRQLFFQNDHGDVVREIVISGKDTTLMEESSYIYDAKDNWIRRVKIPLKYNPSDYMGKDGTVMDREIVY
jgi:hypothetical protein